jgi:YihY family inner membrane protein
VAATTEPDVRISRPLRPSGLLGFCRDAVERFIAGDGTSHTRALAYQSMFMVLSGFIGFVGLVSVIDLRQVRGTVEQLAQTLAPGPSGRLLVEAAQQGAEGGASAMVAGLGAALVAATLAMAQVERSANRILGSRHDRRAARRFAVAFLLAVSAGILMAAGALMLGAGSAIAGGAGWDSGIQAAWSIARWPLGTLVAFAGVYLLYRFAPRERRASSRALLAGAAVAVALWGAFTGLLSAYFSISSESSQTYGPLLAVVALLLWSVLSSLALHLGLAVSGELASRSELRNGGAVTLPDSATVATAGR